MRSAFLSFLLLSALLFAGCAAPWREAQTNVENSKNLRVGMTKAEVLKIMGEPLQDELFCGPDLWYYYIETVWADGLVAEEECMPLVFEDGKLVGWGRVFLTKYRLRRKDNAKQLVPPAERSAAPAKKAPAEKVSAGKAPEKAPAEKVSAEAVAPAPAGK